MKIVIPGGSGQVGQILARALTKAGHQVVILTRQSLVDSQENQNPTLIHWDAKTLGDWASEIDGADVVINMAGRSVNCRYHARNRKLMIDSRVDSTRVVGQAIAQASNPPHTWLQASTATIYKHTYDQPQDEATGTLGGDEPGAPFKWNFSIEVAKAWERTLEEAETPKTRKVALRSAMTMSPDRGGIFDVIYGMVRKGLGGTNGNGKQYVSWIHEADFVKSVQFILDHPEITGEINLCSPNPLPNKEFLRLVRQGAGKKIGLPAMVWQLEIGAIFLRTETELLLKSRRVVPGRLLEYGYEFEYPEWGEAAKELISRWK